VSHEAQDSTTRSKPYPVSRQELVPWLQQQIAEQKRIDATTSGISGTSDLTQSGILSRDLPTASDVQLVLPGDAKKQRKQTKQMFMDRGRTILPVNGHLN
jgi:eukaryotic translation initiation factor 2-alpha kinase 4